MTDDLLLRLRARYPALLGDPLLREIGCFPGWFQLLDDLCKTLQGHLDAHPEVPAIKVVRIKEKWGQLRFNFNGDRFYSAKSVVSWAIFFISP